MTRDESWAKLFTLAGEIAITTPRAPKPYTPRAYVSWDIILELRGVLAGLGFDEETARRRYERLKADISQRRAAERERT